MEVLHGGNCPEGVVLTFGNFDGVHLGHARIFSEVKRLARENNLATAVLTFSPHPAEVLKERKNFLLLDFERKVELISKYGIDYLCIMEFTQPFAKLLPGEYVENTLIRDCSAKWIVVGENCVFGHKCKGDLESLRAYAEPKGCSVVGVKQLIIDGVMCSSSYIREYLQCGDTVNAKAFLGRYHSVSGLVIRGVARGRAMGFPTLNVSLNDVVLPKRGVYRGKVRIGDQEDWLSGVVNIGVRPTFSDADVPILEMHILDFDRDIYGERVTVELMDFVRSEQKFPNVEALVAQIKKDIEIVRLMCAQA